MPPIYSSKCDQCDFSTKGSSGARLYVLDKNGNRIICPHPGEYHKIAEVLEISKEESFAWVQRKLEKIPEEIKKKIKDSLGMEFQYICLDCLAETFLDKKKDELKCGSCGSTNIKYVANLVDKPCPKCKKGTIRLKLLGIS